MLSDNAEATARAILGMAKRGHRRIAFLCDRAELYTAQARLQGYRDALAALGIAEDPALVRANLANPASTDAAVRELFALPDPPTALFTGQNLITTATLHTLRALGLQQLDRAHRLRRLRARRSARSARHASSRRTSPRSGRTAAELLFARIDGDTSPSKRVVVPTTLIERGSGEIAP